MSSDGYLRRREKLIRKLSKLQVEALLVTDVTNVTYLTGFSGDSSYLLIGPAVTQFISDTRYETQLQEECPGVDAYIRSNREKLIEATATVLKRRRIGTLAFESHATSYEQWQKLSAEVKHLELVGQSGLVEELRQVKDAGEIAEIRRAVDIAERGFDVLRATLTAGMTERQAAHDLEHAMRRFGAAAAGFEPIVAAGPRAALPHARPTDLSVCCADLLLVDWGARTTSGYRSDLTRVLVTGKLSPKLERVYKVVFEAQRRGIAAIRPGARCGDVDARARSVIESAGFGKHFGHGLGHGIGLNIHELPRISPIEQAVLKPGMVVTVEPGVYLPGWGGVRIEDDVLVTRDGREVLTSVPKALDEVMLPLSI